MPPGSTAKSKHSVLRVRKSARAAKPTGPSRQAAVRQPHAIPVDRPPFRLLRVLAFDPSLSIDLENAVINQVTMKVQWEPLAAGPVGEYLEVVDVDPASNCAYEPLDLEQPYLLAQSGLAPSEGNPQFHQQMVYAVAMTTIRNFERALGRTAFWSSNLRQTHTNGKTEFHEDYVPRLRIYPHGLRDANAFYSPGKKALLFGYFPASTSDPRFHLPGGTVFACLSHDVVAHETTHALLDGMHRRFNEASNPDVLAFHEGFADIVALLQHFSMPDVLRHQIARTRGDLATENLLTQLAQEFGQATGSHGALRDALGEYDENGNWKPKPADPNALADIFEPHARGSLLVAAIFDAFTTIFKARIADLLRIATSGTGVLPAGNLHPDLVNRLAEQAAKAAQHVLNMCIRALDYCPPVDLTYGDYLRALITADYDLVRDDDLGYRIAFIESFRRRGIYPRDVRSLAVDGLRWVQPMQSDWAPQRLPVIQRMNEKMPQWTITGRTEEIFWHLRDSREILHGMLNSLSQSRHKEEMQQLLALDPARPFEVHSLRPARRVGPDGQLLSDLVIEITQQRPGYFDADVQKTMDERAAASDKSVTVKPDFAFRGGCTLILDTNTSQVRYSIYKNVCSDTRLARQRDYMASEQSMSLRMTYFGEGLRREPFALLHRAADWDKEGMEWAL